MRIGIDATAMPRQRTGAGNYIFNLVRALSRIDDANEYVVFAKSHHVEELSISADNFTFVRTDPPSRGLRLLWEQTALPMHAKRHRLDVLHSPHYTMPVIASCPRVVTFHDATFFLFPELHQPIKRAFFPRMIRWSGRHADELIADSESTRQDIIAQCGVSPDRIHTVHIAASADCAPPDESELLDVLSRHGLERGRYLLYVGVLEPRKNVPQLVEAFGRVAAACPSLMLVIAGRKGWMYDSIFERVVSLGLLERVRFLGYVATEELGSLYAGSRAFVYPSRYEGFGIPVLEAMQAGAAVITSDRSSLSEIAGDAALLVDPDDVSALAEALKLVVTDDALARSLVDRGLKRAAMFSWDRTAAATLAVYRLAAAGR
jgi:glycosyltransferase involved in cell wall biosynthesis